ncbi:hypothetical protein Saa2_08673 [Streptomyces acidiscabies]|nr:hypothetical protein Saa2_08673 [Streptomyces acidiscabies]
MLSPVDIDLAHRIPLQPHPVHRRIPQPPRHLTMPRIQPLLREQVGDDQLPFRAAVEEPAVGEGRARDRLQAAEGRAVEAERGGRGGAVGGFEGDQAARRADEGRARAQELVEGLGERVRTGDTFREFVERREVRDPAGEPVLEGGAGCRCAGGGRGGQRDGRGGRARGHRRGSVGGCGNRGIDSGHFRRVRGVHGVRLSDRCVLLKSIANPHVILLILHRRQCLHIYTHS